MIRLHIANARELESEVRQVMEADFGWVTHESVLSATEEGA